MGVIIQFANRPAARVESSSTGPNAMATSLHLVQVASTAMREAGLAMAETDIDNDSKLSVLHQLRTSMEGLRSALGTLGIVC